jgi:hypothetical protein
MSETAIRKIEIYKLTLCEKKYVKTLQIIPANTANPSAENLQNIFCVIEQTIGHIFRCSIAEDLSKAFSLLSTSFIALAPILDHLALGKLDMLFVLIRS